MEKLRISLSPRDCAKSLLDFTPATQKIDVDLVGYGALRQADFAVHSLLGDAEVLPHSLPADDFLLFPWCPPEIIIDLDDLVQRPIDIVILNGLLPVLFFGDYDLARLSPPLVHPMCEK